MTTTPARDRDTRRDQYAAVIRACMTRDEDTPGELANAVMAVADRERGIDKAALAGAGKDIARLRAELAEANRRHENFKKGATFGGQEMRKRLTEAEDRAAEVRAAALEEAADALEADCPDHTEHGGRLMTCQCEGAAELRRMAAAARPDNTTGAQRPVSLGTPCARCGHARNWHESGRCTLTAGPNRCGCRNFTPDDTTGA